MDEQFKLLYDTGIVPVINIEDPETAVPLAEALCAGGLPLIEVTLRNDTALQSIERIHRALPHMTVIAGTIQSVSAVEEARAAGAVAMVAAGFQEKTVAYCVGAGIPIIPGCVTPTEIQAAVDLGLKTLKFFPAGRYGGVAALKDLSGPFGNVRFVPTGGIGMDELGSYLSCDAVAAVGGSFVAKADVIARHDWETITGNCKRAIALSLGFELAHIGLNHGDKEEALEAARALNARFPMGVQVGNGKSSFLGTAVELMHTPYYGTHGHIAFRTNSVERAKAYFEKQGFAIREDSISYDKKGAMKFFYLRDEVDGFALHVVKK